MKTRFTQSLLCGVTVSLLSIFLVANVVSADPPLDITEEKLTASDTEALDFFGWSVSASDGAVVVGAFGDDEGGSEAGAAYVFRFDGTSWLEEAKLIGGDTAEGDRFGTSVSISGDIAVVGAPRDDAGKGAAYVITFDGTNWIEAAKLIARDGEGGDRFGSSVSVSGDTVVVGAPGYDEDSGAAYVFFNVESIDATEAFEDVKLIASDGASGDSFGDSVSVSGDAVVVGAPGDEEVAGAAYLFLNVESIDATEAFEDVKLIASDGELDDRFGNSVSVTDDTVVVGAFGDDPENEGEDGDEETVMSTGSAYVFLNVSSIDETPQVEDIKLIAGDAEAFDFFGWSVSVSDGTVVVGAFGDDEMGSEAGAAYVFMLESEPKSKKISSSLGKSGHRRGPDWDVFTFTGGEGEEVTITLEVDLEGVNNGGERATLIVKNKKRCVWFFRILRGALPSQITATLPGDCEYLIGVFEQPRFVKGEKFKGDYSITLESSGDAYQTLEPTCWVE